MTVLASAAVLVLALALVASCNEGERTRLRNGSGSIVLKAVGPGVTHRSLEDGSQRHSQPARLPENRLRIELPGHTVSPRLERVATAPGRRRWALLVRSNWLHGQLVVCVGRDEKVG